MAKGEMLNERCVTAAIPFYKTNNFPHMQEVIVEGVLFIKIYLSQIHHRHLLLHRDEAM
jgi:hypothetical protein